jgi:hypothetical protein
MVFRPRQATSGTILCLASAILLALVSFNTPLLKSMYFLEATFSTGQYAGRLRLGTLGYCLMVDGNENCVGPTVGYNFSESLVTQEDYRPWELGRAGAQVGMNGRC